MRSFIATSAVALLAAVVVSAIPQGFEGQRAVANPPGVPGRFTCFEEDGRQGIQCCDGSGACADAALIADNDQNEPRRG